MNSIGETLEQFATTLQQQVLAYQEAEETGAFKEEMFTRVMVDYLSDAGEIENAEICLHRARGIHISGYALSENGESLDLIVAHNTDTVPPTTVTKTEVDQIFRRLVTFYEKACAGYHLDIEESGAAFDIAQQIYNAVRAELTQIRFLLITDGIVKVAPPQHKDLPGIRANFEIWDIERLYRFVTSGRERETIEIDFSQILGTPIPCLSQPDTTPGYAAYLAIFPAKALVDIYGQYGSRLLERNVRSFLQARGKINVGMRDTIRKEPHMFLAFNNGLSATAEAITTQPLPAGGLGIKTIRDLQIVNGGQTTASIYHSVKKDKADVSQLFVQVKITVLNDPARMDDVVPLISRYANSQNKVQEADLAANHAFHQQLEELSRTVWAPAKVGKLRQTHWFYERARGQYLNERLRAGTRSKIQEFETLFPKEQLFTKTDLAKVIVTWHLKPEIVSKGAQACFSWFMSNLDTIVQEDGALDASNFERLVAKLILFRSAERLIKSKDMPFTGYWANIVTYTVARLVHETHNLLDMNKIWKEQKINSVLETAIIDMAKQTWSHIIDPYGGANVTQYCKQSKCWTLFLERQIYISDALKAEMLVNPDRLRTGIRADVSKIAKQETVQRAMLVDATQWFEIYTWAKDQKTLNALQLEQIMQFAEMISSGKRFTPSKANDAIKILETVSAAGFGKRV